MNLVDALFERKSLTITRSGLLQSGRTAAGRYVDVDAALTQATVFACVSLIAESVGMLPLILYKRLPRGKERGTDHRLYNVLHNLPNPELTAMEMGENIAGHLALWGNAYCEIELDRAGRAIALWPLRPDRMAVDVNDRNQRVYDYTLPSGETKRLSRERVWHVRGWGTDAWLGRSRIDMQRETIGLALAESEYGARFFGNDSRPGGILKHPNKLKDPKRLADSWHDAHAGLDNAHRVAVLEEGVEWQQIGIPPEEAQFLESRKYQQTEICGIFRVPPHMVGIVDSSTSWGTGIGQQTQMFVTFSLGPYLKRIEQSAGRDLLTENERREYFPEYLSAALVQNDLAARTASYTAGRNGGWLSPDDIRDMENLNPIPGGGTYLQPLNMAPLGSEPEPAKEVVK